MADSVLNKGKVKLADPKDKPKYSYVDATDIFAMPTLLTPGLSGIHPGRILIGAKAGTQAITLVNREAPLVRTVGRRGDQSAYKMFGDWNSLRAHTAGTVTNVDKDEITIETATGIDRYPLYDHYNLGRKTFITHYPKVKVGDKVQTSQLLATTNYTDDKGVLAIGTNVKCAVVPWHGKNFEDAYVVTETGAKKLEAEQMLKFQLEEKFGTIIDKKRYVGLFPNKFFNDQLANIDDRGIVKVGTIVKHGDPLILGFSPKSIKSTDAMLGRISAVMKNAYSDQTVTWHYASDGQVVDAVKSGDLVSVNVKMRRGLSQADKLSNFFGAKGVIRIIPDSEAPQLKDGTVPDVLLNSQSLVSRVAPALLVSMGLGKVAQKTGKPVQMQQFVESNAAEETLKLMKKHGVDLKEKAYNPLTKTEIEMSVGPLYVSRLVHNAEDKLSTRSQGTGYTLDDTPGKTEEESSKKIGGLGSFALLGHGAVEVLKDFSTVKASRNDDFWTKLKLGQPLPTPPTPPMFNKFMANMEGAGIKVDRKGSKFELMPMTNSEILKKSQGQIYEPLTFRVKEDKLVPEEKGLFDPSITGINGERYNHIKLHHPVLNPVAEKYIRKLLKLTGPQLADMIAKNQLKATLSQINIDTKLQELRQYLKSGKRTDRDDTVKMLAFLTNLKRNNIPLADLVLENVLVLPAKFRPVTSAGGVTLSSDVNYLYKDLMMHNKALEDTTDVPDDVVHDLKKKQQDAVNALYGLGEPINTKSQEKGFKGLLASTFGIKGNSPKMSMFQSKVVNHTLDLVGRSVILPESRLGVDELSIPQDMAWALYNPFIIRRMVQKGVPATKASEYVKSRHPLALEALNEELKSRPAIMSRDPAWHKFNFMGFKVRMNEDPKDVSIKYHPTLTTGFNSDHDGDQTNINVPVLESARKEILSTMLPSQNVLHHKTMEPILMPKNEASLGLYQLSTMDNHNQPKKYTKIEEVLKDYADGKLHPGDRIELPD